MEYLTETHCHTRETSQCGRLPAKRLVELLCERGYKTAVITDHLAPYMFTGETNWPKIVDRFLKGYRAARDEGVKRGMNILLGMELRTSKNGDNEFLCYGFDESFLLENKWLQKMSIAEFSKLFRNDDRLIIQAHPYRWMCTQENPGVLDGCEVFNGNTQASISSSRETDAYVKRHNLIGTSGSDLHCPEDVGSGGIITARELKDTGQFVSSLRNREFKLIKDGI